jgi:hypothetical protein
MDGSVTSTVLEQDKKQMLHAQQLALYAAAFMRDAFSRRDALNFARPATLSMGYQPSVVYSVVSAYQQACDHLGELERLPDDWDGYGALRVSDEARNNAMSLIHSTCMHNLLAPSPTVSPNPNGTVSLEWQTDDREAYIEIGNTKASGYCRFSNQKPLYLQGSPEEVSAILPGLVSLLSEPARPLVPMLSQTGAWVDDDGTD